MAAAVETGSKVQPAAGLNGVKADYCIEGLILSDIAIVTVNEKPREKTFYNIRMLYPDRPARTYPAYLDVMAKRLNLNSTDGEYLREHTIDTLDSALKVIDVVRDEKLSNSIPSTKMPSQIHSAKGWECWLEPAESDVTVFPGGKLPAAESKPTSRSSNKQ